MIIAYQNALLVTAHGIQQQPLVVDTHTGRILPPNHPAGQMIDAQGLVLYPGLINAHDHLELNHYPRTKWRECYPNARQWAQDMTPRLDEDSFRSLNQLPLPDRCLSGGLKNLFCGVTTVAHHNPLHKPLKRRDFPVRVLRQYGWAHSVYLASVRDIRRAHRKRGPFFIHVAEGTDSSAAAELDTLEKMGCLTLKTVLIHGIALSADAIQQAGGLVWCPSTNFYLLGQTAEVRPWYAAGKLALGSDSRLTADGDLLDELRAAHRTDQLTAQELFHTVTDNAARLLQLNDVGDLRAGMRADVMALRYPSHGDVYRALIEAKRTDIVWLMRDGKCLWRQVENPQAANCQLDNIPYHLDERILKQAKKSQISETGFKLKD